MTWRPIRVDDTLGVGDRVTLACDCDVSKLEGVIVGALDRTTEHPALRIEVEFAAHDLTTHLVAHGMEHADAIAMLDQHRAAEGNPSTVVLPAQVAELLCRGDEDES